MKASSIGVVGLAFLLGSSSTTSMRYSADSVPIRHPCMEVYSDISPVVCAAYFGLLEGKENEMRASYFKRLEQVRDEWLGAGYARGTPYYYCIVGKIADSMTAMREGSASGFQDIMHQKFKEAWGDLEEVSIALLRGVGCEIMRADPTSPSPHPSLSRR